MSDLEVRLQYKRSEQDDWTKIEDKAVRKKIQDRLAKRKSRSKAKQSTRTALQQTSGTVVAPAREIPANISTAELFKAALKNHFATDIPNPTASQLLFNFLFKYTLSSLSSTLFEHHFIRLSQYSLYRAFVCNANILALNLQDFESDDALSPWTIEEPYPIVCDHSLVPLREQLQNAHHPFIDVVAPRSLRRRFFEQRLTDEQEEDLCFSLHGGGFVVWGENCWDENGWEMSQEFLDRWPNLVEEDVISTSNRWRTSRGEAPLKVPTTSIIEEVE